MTPQSAIIASPYITLIKGKYLSLVDHLHPESHMLWEKTCTLPKKVLIDQNDTNRPYGIVVLVDRLHNTNTSPVVGCVMSCRI